MEEDAVAGVEETEEPEEEETTIGDRVEIINLNK